MIIPGAFLLGDDNFPVIFFQAFIVISLLAINYNGQILSKTLQRNRVRNWLSFLSKKLGHLNCILSYGVHIS